MTVDVNAVKSALALGVDFNVYIHSPYSLTGNKLMQVSIAPYMLSTYKLIQCAFPNGVDSESYFPLLALLYIEMSHRCLAQVVSQYTGKDYYLVLNDVYAVGSTNVPTPSAIAKVKQRLLACGYEEWLKEE